MILRNRERKCMKLFRKKWVILRKNSEDIRSLRHPGNGDFRDIG